MSITDSSISTASLARFVSCLQEAEARALTGAAWLDEHVPDWIDRVDVAELKLNDSSACVLGQVAGSIQYGQGYGSIAGHCHSVEELMTEGARVRFDLDSHEGCVLRMLGATRRMTQLEAEDRGFVIRHNGDVAIGEVGYHHLDLVWKCIIGERLGGTPFILDARVNV